MNILNIIKKMYHNLEEDGRSGRKIKNAAKFCFVPVRLHVCTQHKIVVLNVDKIGFHASFPKLLSELTDNRWLTSGLTDGRTDGRQLKVRKETPAKSLWSSSPPPLFTVIHNSVSNKLQWTFFLLYCRQSLWTYHFLPKIFVSLFFFLSISYNLCVDVLLCPVELVFYYYFFFSAQILFHSVRFSFFAVHF